MKKLGVEREKDRRKIQLCQANKSYLKNIRGLNFKFLTMLDWTRKSNMMGTNDA